MIYTCSHKNYNSNKFKTYAISGNKGKDANYNGESFNILAPKLRFWKIWHNNIGKIDEKVNNYYYIEEYYKQVLMNLSPIEIYKQLDNSILLCYENNYEFCHRHIVSAWLELSLDIPVLEIKIDDDTITFLQRPAYIKDYLIEIMNKYNDNDLNCKKYQKVK